jgi:diguanylate cyclase (GGDEF)-like protein/PAS domain S-box-containing protein
MRDDVPAAPRSSDLHETVVENLFDGVYYVDRKRTITYWNPGAERISGYPADEVVGRRCYDNILGHVNEHGDKLCLTTCPLVRAMAQRRGVEQEVSLRHKDGHRVPVHVRCQPVRDHEGAVVGAVEIFNDDHAYRDALHRIGDLEKLSSTDSLTGLVNRRTAEISLCSRLREALEANWPLGILFVDVDEFKAFNDVRGHAVGDAVLRTVARSMAASLRESDLAARWGGDEFVVLSAASDRAQLGALARRLCSLVGASSAESGGEQLGITVSVGATLATPTDTDQTLLERADRALYESKVHGRNQITIG